MTTSIVEHHLRELLRDLLRSDEGREVMRQIIRDELRAGAGEPEWLTVSEAARLASCAPGTVRRWAREGHLRPAGSGRGMRIKRAELLRYLESRRRPEHELSPEDRADEFLKDRAS